MLNALTVFVQTLFKCEQQMLTSPFMKTNLNPFDFGTIIRLLIHFDILKTLGASKLLNYV
jgi:hypothetical protein